MAAEKPERAARSEIEARLLRREKSPVSVGDVFSAVMGDLDARGSARSTWSAGRAWYAVNGDIERAHTTGVFVREPSGRQTLPTLIVYVDSRARATDFTANREIYLGRLERVGWHFEEVQFRESKRPAALPAPARERRSFSPDAAPLSDADAARIDELCAEVPESLRESVSRAMRESWQRTLGRNS